jgi:hypothetical protein
MKLALAIIKFFICLWILHFQILNTRGNLNEISCAQNGIWGRLNPVCHITLPSICVTLWVPLLSLLDEGSVQYFPRRMPSSGMLCRVAAVRTDVSKRKYRLHYKGEMNQGTRNNVSSNWQPKHIVFLHRYLILLVIANILPSWFLSPWWQRRYVPPKYRFLQDSDGVRSQKMAFFIVTAVKISNLTYHLPTGLCRGDVMFLLWDTNWVLMSEKTLCIVTAVKTSYATRLCKTWKEYSVVTEFLAANPEVRVRFPAPPDFLSSSGSGTGSTQPLWE